MKFNYLKNKHKIRNYAYQKGFDKLNQQRLQTNTSRSGLLNNLQFQFPQQWHYVYKAPKGASAPKQKDEVGGKQPQAFAFKSANVDLYSQAPV